MKREDVERLLSKLKQAIGILGEVADELARMSGPELTTAEKVRRIVEKIGLRQAAWRLEVDVSTVCRWRRGKRPSKKNLLKIEALYGKLFGKE